MKTLRIVLIAVGMAAACTLTARTGNDGPFTTGHWTNGLYAQQANGPVMLYPVPAREQVNVIYPGLTGKADVTLIAGDGRIIRSIEVGETHAAQTVVDVSNLDNGIYFLRVVQPSGLDVTKRLVVANDKR
jgi:hypothetical protein